MQPEVPPMADIALKNVTKTFGKTTGVSNFDLDIADGEFVVLLGPTGAGKTTTLRLVAGLEKPTTGQVMIDGRDMTSVSPAERDVTFVFQQYSLYPHLSVYDNMAFPLRSPMRKMPEDQIRRRIMDVASLLRIEDKLQNMATRLSGGQMQRVAIGRALVRQPSIYLMDEPLSSLDAKLRSELRVELKHIQTEMGATILYVTHDQIEAMTMASRIGVLEQGRLAQIGTPREIYENPVSLYVATRLGQPVINILPRNAVQHMPAPARATTVGARTEHIRLSRSTQQGGGTVKWIEHLGDQNHLHIDYAGQDVVTLADPDEGLSVGDHVGLEFIRPIFFDAGGLRIAA
jgi:multiple sugar transport system ATP-binding protein